MKLFHFYVLFFISLSLFSQEKFSKQIRFSNDNDLYVSINKDRYYTNGMFLSFSYLSKDKSTNLEKKIFTWEIGHQIFTPYKTTVSSIIEHDRPFAGYLYGGFGMKKAYKNNQIFTANLQVGLIGSNAYGKDLQNFIHDIYGFEKVIGWKHQIKNALGINLGGTYIKHLTVDSSNKYDISWFSYGEIGTVSTNISTGFFGRIGFKPLQKLVNSIAFNTNINDKNTKFKREIESFIYLKPMLRYAFYDATLQGSFLSSNNDVTSRLIPLVFDVEIGFKFTGNRFNFGYAFHYNTNKSKGLKFTNGNIYGSISVNYLIH